MPSEQKGAYGGHLALFRFGVVPVASLASYGCITSCLCVASDEVIVRGRVLKWGNAYGIRLRLVDLKKAGLTPGAEAIVRLRKRREHVDLSGLPTFGRGRSEDSLHHDGILAHARNRALRDRRPD